MPSRNLSATLTNLVNVTGNGNVVFSGSPTIDSPIITTNIGLPTGNTAARPATPTAGNLRFNSDVSSFEGYNGTKWGSIGGGLAPTPIKTANGYVAVANDLVRCNTAAGAFSVSFPSSPTDGDIIGIVDIANRFNTYNLTLLSNTKSIELNSTSYVLDINGAAVSFVYNSSTTNWKLLSITNSLANSAFSQANTATTIGQAGFAQANAAYNTANTKFSANGGTISGSVTITTDLSVTGNVYLSGNVTTLNSNNISISDPLIYLAQDNPANLQDIGIVGHFTSGNYQHTGFVRDATDGVWKLFSNVSTEPSTTIDFSGGVVYDTIKVGSVTASNASFTVATGSAPFTVASNTLVSNLNVDLLDGQHGAYYTDLSNTALATANAAYNKANTITSGLAPTSIQTANYTAAVNDLVRCNTAAGAFSVTFPASPTDGAIIGVIDIAGTFNSNNLTLLPNTGKTIESDDTSLILDMTGTYVSFVYSSATSNWKLLETPLGSSLLPTPIITSSYNAVVNDIVRCNTAGGSFAITFPSSPADGSLINVVDVNGTFYTNNLTINRSGSNTIEGDTSVILDVNNAYASFMYNALTSNWRLLQTPIGFLGNVTANTSVTGMVKISGTVLANAVAGVDYLAPPSGTSILKANSSGALANAVAGVDYMAAVAPGANNNILTSNGTSWVSTTSTAASTGKAIAMSIVFGG